MALQSQVIPFGALARCPGDRQLLKASEASVADRSANSQHCHSSVLVDGDEGSSRRQAPLQMSCSGRRLSTRDPSFLRTLQRLVTCVATAHYDGDIIKTIAQVGDGSSTCSLCTHPLSGSTRALPCCGAVASPHGPCVPGCPPCERGVWTSPQNLLHSGILCVQYPRQFCANLWALAVGGMWCSAPPPTTASPLAAIFKRSAHHDGPRCLACGDGQMAHPSTCGDAAVISGSLTAHAYGAPGVLRLSLRPRLSCQAPGPRPPSCVVAIGANCRGSLCCTLCGLQFAGTWQHFCCREQAGSSQLVIRRHSVLLLNDPCSLAECLRKIAWEATSGDVAMETACPNAATLRPSRARDGDDRSSNTIMATLLRQLLL